MSTAAQTALALAALALAASAFAAIAPSAAALQQPTSAPSEPLGPRELAFAAIGDYGIAGQPEADVSALVHAFQPDLVITLGDNNYLVGSASSIDANIGQYYHDYIRPYAGSYGAGASVNRFFPSLGNHDWLTSGAAPYLAYFELPGNERYYDFRRGPVHFFALDSDEHEPDGIGPTSAQAAWLQARLAASDAPFRVVYMHHPPYSSADHGSTAALQWPFEAWGADLVLAGHDHVYERAHVLGLPYVVNGVGGKELYAFGSPIGGSQVRFPADFGALLCRASDALLQLRFVTRAGAVIDELRLTPHGIQPPQHELVAAGSTWHYLDTGADPGSAWTSLAFDDSAWKQGPAELGYGDGDEATVVSFGSDPRDKHVTTWFRRVFPVADPAALTSLALALRCDDGAAVYLNGTEVMRQDLPAGALAPSTLAPVAAADALETSWWNASPPPSLLAAGANVLAVEVHQASPSSSDVSFDLELVGVHGTTAFVPAGAAWRYLDTGVAPAAEWVQSTFDDAAWKSGPAPLGYGDGDEATVVSFGTDPAQKHVTTWFRRQFTVQGAERFRALLARATYDDGLIVYLNGQEALRLNLPAGGVSAATLAPFSQSAPVESTPVETSLDPRLLRDGVNQLAVELHQSSPASSDLGFALELIGF